MIEVSDQIIHRLQGQHAQNLEIQFQILQQDSNKAVNNSPRFLEKQPLQTLLERYEVNKMKYEGMLYKSGCLNGSRLAKTDNCLFEEGENITINDSLEEDLEINRGEGKDVSLKEILEQRKLVTFKKKTDLSCSQMQTREKWKNQPKTEAALNLKNTKSLADSGTEFFKRKTVSATLKFPEKMMLKGWIKSAGKNKYLEDSNNTSGASEQTKLMTKRKSKDMSVFGTHTKETKGQWNLPKYFIRKDCEDFYSPKQKGKINLTCNKFERIKKVEENIELIELKEHNKTLQESLKKIKVYSNGVICKYKKSQNSRKLLVSSLAFQKNSYSTLLGHHSNEMELLNKQIEELESVKNASKQLCLSQAEQIKLLAEDNSLLMSSLKEKDTQIQQMQLKFQQASFTYASKIEIFENQIRQLNFSLNEAKNELQERALQATNNIQLLSDLKGAQNMISVLKQKYQELETYVKMVNSAKDHSSDNSIEGYMKQIFNKYQKSAEELVNMKGNIMRYENEMRMGQRILSQLKLQIQYKECSLNQLRIEQDGTNNKLRTAQNMLETVNDCLLRRQLEFGNYRYETTENMEQLKEENESLRKQLNTIVERLDLLENKIENREFDDGSQSCEYQDCVGEEDVIKKLDSQRSEKGDNLASIEAL